MTNDVRRARTAFLWVGVIVPAAIVVLASVVVATWLPELPEPSAVHWSGEGPDGFGPGWTHLATLLGLGGGMIAFFAVIAWFAHRLPGGGRGATSSRPGWSPIARFLGAVNLGLAGLMSLTTLVAVGVQRGLADAAQAPEIGPWVLLGFVLLVGLGVLGWFLQPKATSPRPAVDGPAEPLPLAVGEKAAWMGTATMARGGQIVLGISLLLLIAVTVVGIAVAASSWWIVAASTLVVVFLVAASLTFRVRVGPAGLLVRSAVGWPKIHIRAGDVGAVRATEVNPLAEFGGWGYRFALDGRRGVVLRAGDALEVTRVDGRVFVVTVDDAATAASVLAAAVAAHQGEELR